MITTRKAFGHIPSLDGIRAFAIYTVIALHITQRFALLKASHLSGALKNLLLCINVDGVGLFFVLSGFLITTLLLREQEKTSRIDLPAFYIRRTFRILPPLYAYLLFVVVFFAVIHYPVHITSIAGSVFFYRNYFSNNSQWFVEHTWSLCVEEQFYLLWPIAFIWAFKRSGRNFAIKVVLIIIAITPVLRLLTYYSHVALFDHKIGMMLHTRMDGLMCGCLAALLTGTAKFESLYRRIAGLWWLFAIEFLWISPALYMRLGPHYKNGIGYTIDSICMTVFILWASRNPGSSVGRILNNRVVARIGVLSYSIYLWQTFFLHADNPTSLNRMPWGVAYIFAAALLSYYLVEQPSLRLRKAIEKRRRRKADLARTAA